MVPVAERPVSPLDVDVSAGSAPCGADLADFLPGPYGLAYLDRDRAEMAMRRTFSGVILDDGMTLPVERVPTTTPRPLANRDAGRSGVTSKSLRRE